MSAGGASLLVYSMKCQLKSCPGYTKRLQKWIQSFTENNVQLFSYLLPKKRLLITDEIYDGTI